MRFRALAVPLLAPAFAFALAHCVGDEPAFPGVDASSANDSATDAPITPSDANGANLDAGTEASVDAAPCNSSAAFANITNVTELNGPTDDESARLTPEALTLYFSRRAGPKPDEGGLTVYSATRGDQGAAFGALTALALGLDPSGPSITADRSTLYYSAGDTDAGPDIMAATLPFAVSTSKNVTKINSGAWDYTPYVRPDNLEIYFTSRRLGTTDDIFVSPRVNGDFDSPVPIAAINTTTSNERAPVISADGKTLFYASDKGGNFEIYFSTRATLVGGFGAGTLVKELSGTSQDLPDWISPDGCTLYFRSDRAGGKGGKDIWRATRP